MAFVQTANSGTPSGTATSKAAIFAGAQTAGNLNVVAISFGNASSNSLSNLISSVTDTKGNTYVASTTFQLCTNTGTALGQIVYAAPNIIAAAAGANTVTVTLSATRDFFTIAVFEYSGLAVSSPVEIFTGAIANGPSASNTAATGSLTTTGTDTLFAAFSLFDGPSTGLTGGFTQRAKYYTQLEADQVGAAPGTYFCNANSNGSAGWIAQQIAFKAPSGALTITPSGIASTIIFGTASVSPGAVAIAPSGIASTTTFGTAAVGRGVASIAPSGIASTNAFGTASVIPGVASIAPSGIASVTAFGTATLASSGSMTITPPGIASVTAFGTASVAPGTINIAPSGIGSQNAFGTATLASVSNIAPNGLPSSNAFGTATLATGSVNISASGIASTLALGTPSVLRASLQGITATGIAQTNAFGLTTIIAIPREQPVQPYTGDPQQSVINVPAWIAYREEQWEEGPWVMPPYAMIFPHPAPCAPPERGTDAFHAEWLKTHPRPPRHHGDWRPKSVLPPFVRAQPIKVKTR